MTPGFRRRLIALAWLLCALAGGGAAMAGAVAGPQAEPPIITVMQSGGQQPLDGGVAMLEDASGTLDLAAVRAQAAADWKTPPRLPVVIGYSRSVWWLRLRLRNDGAAPVERLFEVGSAVQDYIDLAVVRGDGRVERFATLGDRVPFSNRPVPSVNPTVPLTIAAHETLDLYLRVSTHDGLYETLPLTLWANQDFARAEQSHWFYSGLFCGLLGLMLAYHSIVYIRTRDPDFALFVGYLLATLLWRATFSGDAFYGLWPGSPAFNNQVLALSVSAWFAFGSLFVTCHLRLGSLLPRAHRYMLTFSALSALTAVPALFGKYALPFILDVPLGLMLPVVLVHCVTLLRRGDRRALWVLIAWAPLLCCGPLYVLQMAGILNLEGLPSASTIVQLALAAQMLVLGGSLAQDMARKRKSLLAAERAARKSHQTQAATLEFEVQQRTLALERANDQLRAMTITDALTGVFNRRHFNESLEHELAVLARQGEMPALCLLDIDHFKAYNDLYGHHKGDEALKAVASELRRQLRRAGDKVFRVGGEEFALLLQPGDIELQQQHVEALRLAIEALGIPHRGNEAFGVVTASFGLVQMPPSDPHGPLTASALYREADRLLYAAKQAGRNCMVCDQRPRAEWANSTDFAPDETQPAAL